MVTRMGQISRLHCVGASIIDEIQHLLAATGDASEENDEFFVTLINEIGIPVMIIGTMRARSLLQKILDKHVVVVDKVIWSGNK